MGKFDKQQNERESSYAKRWRNKGEDQGEKGVSAVRRAMELLTSGKVKEGEPLFASLIALITGEINGGDE